jgi:drug/metabolite transporter (DMT)-like permease
MNVKVLLSFAIVYLVWGSTFTAIRMGLDTFPPFMLASLRFLIAGFCFLLVSKWKDIKTMSFSEFRMEVLVGVLLTCSNAAVCWAQQFIPSGVAALIVGALPVMFILINWVSFEKKTPPISAVMAFAIGLTGISLISLDKTAASNIWVVLALILGNTTWVCGSLLFRMIESKRDYFPRATVQTIFGGIFLMIVSTVIGERAVTWETLQISGALSVLYLALAGTVLAYTAYSFLLKNVRTELTSTYALVNPLFALLLGVLFLNEPFTMKVGIATGLILFSVFLVLYGDKFLRKPVAVTINSQGIHNHGPRIEDPRSEDHC